MTEPARCDASDGLDLLRERLVRTPGVILESLAEEHGISLRRVVACLPGEMRVEVPGGCFQDVMGDVAGWGSVTFIVHTADGVFEFQGAVPSGSEGRGYFNLQQASGIGGHIRADRCAAIVFLRRPFMGKATASIQFFNHEGGSMFKIFVGRGVDGELCPEQLERFDALGQRFGGTTS